MLTKNQVLDVWYLFREKKPASYKGRETRIENEINYVNIPVPALINAEESHYSPSNKSYTLHEAHSGRAAWLFQPFEHNGDWYPGFEYKGFGAEGRKIIFERDLYWGGVIPEYGLEEFKNSIFAYELSGYSQLPISYFETNISQNDRVAVLVRSYQCALRISNLSEDRKLLKDFLKILGISLKEYAHHLGSVLGSTMKKFLDNGYCKGNVDADNFTAYGEFVDLELANRCVRAKSVNDIPVQNIHSSLQCIFDVIYTAVGTKRLALCAVDSFNEKFLGRAISIENDAANTVLQEFLGKKLKPRECCYASPKKLEESCKKAVEILDSYRKRMFAENKPVDDRTDVVTEWLSKKERVFLTKKEYKKFKLLGFREVNIEEAKTGVWVYLLPWQLQELRIKNVFPTFKKVL